VHDNPEPYEPLTGFLYTRQRVGRETYNVGLYCFVELFIAGNAHELNCKLVLMANFTSQGRHNGERIGILALISYMPVLK